MFVIKSRNIPGHGRNRIIYVVAAVNTATDFQLSVDKISDLAASTKSRSGDHGLDFNTAKGQRLQTGFYKPGKGDANAKLVFLLENAINQQK